MPPPAGLTVVPATPPAHTEAGDRTDDDAIWPALRAAAAARSAARLGRLHAATRRRWDGGPMSLQSGISLDDARSRATIDFHPIRKQADPLPYRTDYGLVSPHFTVPPSPPVQMVLKQQAGGAAGESRFHRFRAEVASQLDEDPADPWSNTMPVPVTEASPPSFWQRLGRFLGRAGAS